MEISKKFEDAKLGDMFYESPTIFAKPRALIFEGISHSQRQGTQVVFKIGGTSTRMHVDADDRYGRYPPLTSTNEKKILKRIQDLHDELERYKFLLQQIEDEDYSKLTAFQRRHRGD